MESDAGYVCKYIPAFVAGERKADKMIYIAALVLGVLFVWFLLLAAGLGAMADHAREEKEREP